MLKTGRFCIIANHSCSKQEAFASLQITHVQNRTFLHHCKSPSFTNKKQKSWTTTISKKTEAVKNHINSKKTQTYLQIK
jgi:hypothetical protein